ncbi:peptidoglycan DD-metalloendopeptidase family protein [Tepidibacillus marianensis]|uniref:peptidoglycan DD-metalloendopeptidase family protein n=1 Tax=Tepidibacillus marianensis TaxID=3131995 RepID=UPI0030D02A27
MQSLNERFIEMKDKFKENMSSAVNMSKDRLNYLQQHISENNKRSLLIGSIAGAIILSSAFGLYYYQVNAQTLYHVYADGKLVGTVNSKNVIEEWKKDQLEKAQTTYNLKSIASSNKITYQEETIFKGQFNNEETVKSLNHIFHIEANGTAIVINGKKVGVVKDKATADQILERIKQGYSPKVEKGKVKAASLNGSDVKVEGVSIKEKVNISQVSVSPDEVMTEEQFLKLVKQGTLEQKKYKVQDKDTISEIANKHGLTTKQLYQLNPDLSGELIHIGDELNVTAVKPLLTVLVKETVVQQEAIPYTTQYQNDSSMYKNQLRTTQTGKNGSKTVTYEVYTENGVQTQRKVLNEKIVTKPVDQIIKRGTKVAPSRGSGSLTWPAFGGIISSPFGGRWGRMHEGIDISGVSNHSIKAADSGVISFTGWKNGYGNTTIINHNNGMQTWYAHQSEILVSVGTRVDKGQVIGVMGSTGRSTGTHLHFEVHVGGGVRNPLNYVRR